MRKAIVIPAFNEQKTIKDVIEKVQSFTDFVIVVDDKSTDETIKEVKKTDAILFQHQVNLGYDSALERGILEAIKIKSDIIITFDADGQHPSELIETIFKAGLIKIISPDLSLVLKVDLPCINKS